MRFPRNDKIVIDHSTPTPDPAAAVADNSPRVIFWLRRFLRITFWLCLIVTLALACAFSLFRFYVLPNLDDWRPALSRQISQAAGMPVSLGRIRGEWRVLAPSFTIEHLRIQPDAMAAPLTVREVQVQPSWQSLLFLEPRLALLRLAGLSLNLERRTNGKFYLNGMDLSAGKGDGRALDWLLRQREIKVEVQRFVWQDHLLALPPLEARKLSLTLASGLLGHQLKAVALPAGSQLSHIDFEAEWQGSEVANWQQWQGSATLQADAPQLGWLQRYLPRSPVSVAGAASSHIQIAFGAGRVTRLQGKWQVENAALSLSGGEATRLPRLAGEVDYQSPAPGEHRLHASRLFLQTRYGSLLQDAEIKAGWHDRRGGFVEASGVQLAPVLPLLQPHVPAVAASAVRQLAGELKGLRWQWQGRIDQPQQYRFKTRFVGLAPTLAADSMRIDGGLDGELVASQQGGQLQFSAPPLRLTLPHELREPLRLTGAQGELRWQRQAQGWRLQVPQLDAATPDFSARLQGEVLLPDNGPSDSRLTLAIAQVPVQRIAAYLPALIGKETIAWLQAGLQAGTARNVRASLQGDLTRFPFAGGQGGRFVVDAGVADGRLLFDPAWPVLTGIQGRFRMLNDGIEVKAESASTAGIALQQVAVRLPDLMREHATLFVDGKARAELPRMLAYTRASPVDGWLDGFLSTLDATGQAQLDLGLALPLDDLEAARVDGKLNLAGNTLQLRELPLPPLSDIQGVLHFNEHGVSTPGIDYQAFGGSSRLQATLDKQHRMQFVSTGEVQVTPVLQRYVPFLAPYATGSSAYRADFTVGRTLDALTVSAPLQGVSISAPPPLAKPATDTWPLQLGVYATQKGWQVDWQVPGHAQGLVALGHDGSLLGAGVGVGADAPQPDGRIAIRAVAPFVQLEPWLAALPAGEEAAGEWALPLALALTTPRFLAQGKQLNELAATLGWQGGDTPLLLGISSREMRGDIRYMPRGKGRLTARLQHLSLPLPEGGELAGDNGQEINVPGLDVQVDALRWKDRELGALVLKAQHQPQLWLLDEVLLQTPDGSLAMSGAAPEGKSSSARRTEMTFVAKSQDAGKLLARLGVPDALIGGEGELAGRVSWLGHVTAFDLARLAGNVRLDLRKGRFAQVDPGAARLLGVLSLQSLARRIRLDFTDVFSSGFAFDTLTGTADIDAGVFRSSNVLLQGPAARVTLQGEADLANNSQQLRVHITPTLSEGVAVLTGASLLNPIAGAITFAAQKLLKDPVSQILSFDYEVTGSLTEPQVRKVGQQVEKMPAALPAAR